MGARQARNAKTQTHTRVETSVRPRPLGDIVIIILLDIMNKQNQRLKIHETKMNEHIDFNNKKVICYIYVYTRTYCTKNSNKK